MVTKVSVGGAGNNDCYSSERCMVTLSESCMEWNGANSNLAVHFDLFFLSTFSKFLNSHSR